MDRGHEFTVLAARCVIATDWDLMVAYEAKHSPRFKYQYLHPGRGVGEAKIEGTC
jgi:hypothetical protein